MIHATMSARELAQEALALMDSNDYDATRNLLRSFANEDEHSQRLVATYVAGTQWEAVELAENALTCIMGPSWPVAMGGPGNIRRRSHKWWGGTRLPAKDVRFGALPVEGAYLSALQRHLLANPGELGSATECFLHVSDLTRSLQPPSPGEIGDHPTNWLYRGQLPSPSLPRVTVSYDDFVKDLLRLHRAELSIGERVMRRLVWTARERGIAQREIAGLIERPQTQVFRQLKAVDDDPTLLALGPREINDNFKAGRFDRTTLLKLLSAFPYTKGEFPEDEPEWGYLPGSWDELSQLTLEGEITREELDLVVNASRARSSANE